MFINPHLKKTLNRTSAHPVLLHTSPALSYGVHLDGSKGQQVLLKRPEKVETQLDNVASHRLSPSAQLQNSFS